MHRYILLLLCSSFFIGTSNCLAQHTDTLTLVRSLLEQSADHFKQIDIGGILFNTDYLVVPVKETRRSQSVMKWSLIKWDGKQAKRLDTMRMPPASAHIFSKGPNGSQKVLATLTYNDKNDKNNFVLSNIDLFDSGKIIRKQVAVTEDYDNFYHFDDQGFIPIKINNNLCYQYADTTTPPYCFSPGQKIERLFPINAAGYAIIKDTLIKDVISYKVFNFTSKNFLWKAAKVDISGDTIISISDRLFAIKNTGKWKVYTVAVTDSAILWSPGTDSEFSSPPILNTSRSKFAIRKDNKFYIADAALGECKVHSDFSDFSWIPNSNAALARKDSTWWIIEKEEKENRVVPLHSKAYSIVPLGKYQLLVWDSSTQDSASVIGIKKGATRIKLPLGRPDSIDKYIRVVQGDSLMQIKTSKKTNKNKISDHLFIVPSKDTSCAWTFISDSGYFISSFGNHAVFKRADTSDWQLFEYKTIRCGNSKANNPMLSIRSSKRFDACRSISTVPIRYKWLHNTYLIKILEKTKDSEKWTYKYFPPPAPKKK